MPSRDLNWNGRLVTAFGASEEVNLQPKTISKNNISIIAQIAADGTATGKASMRKTDYEAYTYRDKFAGMADEDRVRMLEKQFGAEIENYKAENGATLYEPASESFDFASRTGVEVIGNNIYLDPLLFFGAEKNPFSNEERKYPVFFGYPKQYKYTVLLQLPEGYAVESLPAGAALTTGEGVANFKINVQPGEKSIQVVMTYETLKMLVAAEFYPILREFYGRMIAKRNEKIVLKKA